LHLVGYIYIGISWNDVVDILVTVFATVLAHDGGSVGEGHTACAAGIEMAPQGRSRCCLAHSPVLPGVSPDVRQAQRPLFPTRTAIVPG
jgi:hypothetical protein